MVTFVNRVKVSVVGTPLTGAVTLGTAVAGYQTPSEAGVQDAATVRYTIDDTNKWEVGTGVITVTAGVYTMARTVIDSSQASGGNITASSNAEVFFTMVGQDIVQNINDIQDVDTQTPQPSANQVLGWDYTSAKWKPQVKGIPILSETPPVDAVDGQIWLDQEDLRSYIRFTDSSSDSWWLETARAGTTGPSGPAGASASVVATVSARDAIAAPTDGLLCWVTQNSTLYIYKLSNTSWREFTFKDDVDTSLALKQDSNLVVADMAALQAISTPAVGVVALVTGLNKVFMYTGTGWFLIAAMTNDSPTAITGVASTYALATDGTVTTITAVSTDPEGFPLTWSYAVTTGSLGSTATVTQAANVFTITPSSTEADAGEFSLTFSVTDGATGAVNATSAFTLSFSLPTIANTVLYAAIESTAPTDTATNSLRSIASSETKWAVTTGTSVSSQANWLDVYNVSDNSLAYSVNLAIPNAYYNGTQLDICDDYIIVGDKYNNNGGATGAPSYGQRGWIGKYNITTGAFITGKTWTSIGGSSSTRGFLGAQVKIKPDGTRIYVTAPRAGFGTSAVGSVYVFDASLSTIATITSPNSNDYWGSSHGRNCSLTCTDSYWAVGHKSATAADVGNVKIYDASNNTLFRTLVHPDGNGTYGFGYSAAMVGDYIAVGSPQGNLASFGQTTGMVYIYKVSTGVLMSQIDVPTGFTKYMFGYQMAMTESTLCVGSYTVSTGEQYAAYDITGISTGNGSLLSGVTLTGLGDSTSNNQIGGPMIGSQSNGNIYMGQSNTPFPGAATPSTLAGYGVGWVTVLE